MRRDNRVNLACLVLQELQEVLDSQDQLVLPVSEVTLDHQGTQAPQDQ